MDLCHPNESERRAKRCRALSAAVAALILLGSVVFAPASAQLADAAAPTRKADTPENGHRQAWFAGAEARLTSEELDRARGGFSTPDGFDFSFGLTNIQRVNHEPLVRQQLFSASNVISALGNDATSAAPTNSVGNPVVLQLGAGNRIDRSVLAQGGGIPKTLIQNSLDNQHIRNTDIYDFRLDNVGAVTRALNQNLRRAALSRQLVDSIR